MAVSSGTRIGPYQVISPLGAGGMGEVYRARDVRLKRDVALKILPDSFASDPDRLARFQREAEVLASLNHPHIAQVYGLEETAGADGRPLRAMAMELVEGDTLADRIARGAVPLDEALAIAGQIAEALEAAHERGVVHRDLKPANIKLTPSGDVKVLDFGLAKALDARDSGTSVPERSQAPTMTSPAMTQAGVILGTAAYMSPEQARGKPVDKRADIWAFGVVFYEMLTGVAPFAGETVTDVLAAVVTKEPDAQGVPPQVRRLLAKCLQKDPRQRLRDIGDAWGLLDAGGTPGRTGRLSDGSAWGRSLPWFVAAGATAVAGMVAAMHFREPTPQPPAPVRFQIQAALEAGSATPSVSPDGRRIVYQTSRGIFVRDLDSVEPRLLVTSDNPVATPFWSADSRFVAYATSSKLNRVDAMGGPSQPICDLRGILLGGVWTANDRVVVSTGPGGLQQVSANGGSLSAVDLPAGVRLSGGTYQMLPDGERLLFIVREGPEERRGIFVGRIDGADTPVRVLPDTNTDVAFVASPQGPGGLLLFLRQGSLMAQPFNAVRAEPQGEPVVVTRDVTSFSASSGTLVYGGATATRRLTWFNRDGIRTGTAWAPGRYNELSLSPDGSRVAVVRAEGPSTWVHEFARESSIRVQSASSAVKPIWSPDASTIVFSSNTDGRVDLWRAASNGTTQAETLLRSPNYKYPLTWSRDGRWVIYASVDDKTREDLWALPLSGSQPGTPEPFLVTDYRETDAAFSPDGRLVAYVSDESGVPEVYVRSFPAGTGGKRVMSSGGGYQPRWRGDGRELFFISAKSELMSVAMPTGPATASGTSRLFPVPIFGGGASINNRYWDVTPDGQRFLVTTAGDGAGISTLTVVLNWQSALDR